jgi:hypothetical protein
VSFPVETEVRVATGGIKGGVRTLTQLIDDAYTTGIFGQVLTSQGPGFPPTWGPGGSGPQNPAFTSFDISGQGSPIEVGATIASGAKTFEWTTSNSVDVQPNSISIVDTTASVTLASGLANTGSDVITISAITNVLPSVQTWTINGLNLSSQTFSDTFTVLWEWRLYAGSSANVTLTANQVKALDDFDSLVAAFAGTYSITNASVVYYYLAWPVSLGLMSSCVDANTGFPISMATVADNAAYSNTANGFSYAIVSVTNANSVTTNYAVYRTQYPFSAQPLLMRIS